MLNSYIAFSSVGALVGLIIASVRSVKPQRDILIDQMREANNNNQWGLVVHVNGRVQMKKTKHVLDSYTNNISVAI